MPGQMEGGVEGGQEGGQVRGRLWRLGVGWESRWALECRRTEGADEEADQFCQNWVHTPGAGELGWPAERAGAGEGKSSAAIYIT